MQVDVLFPIKAEAFTYLVPEEIQQDIKIGSRILAPFKNQKKTGIVIGFNKAGASLDKISLKLIIAVLDKEPIVPESLLKLIKWAGQYYISASGMVLKNAIPSGLFTGRKSGKPRVTYSPDIENAKIVDLTKEQEKSLSEINKADSGIFLLHGVTGSGKTEVYIRAIEALPDNKEAIVLVPEIALTAQIIDRFRSRFNDKVAFYHSGLSMGERMTQWWRIRNGEAKVVLGVRSAVFAPFRNLGLIVVDEEQEASYKQFEGLRYNARDMALVRAKLENIKVILGSATPSLESFYNAQHGKFKYLELNKRVEEKPMPQVEILDMTKESKKTWFFSDRLLNAIKDNNSKGHQSLIMLNRRGYSSFLMCSDCGYTYKCRACSITLTYHKDTKTLNCHYCGSYLMPQDLCPQCKGTKTKYIGVGTQRIEEELQGLIPEISLKRMDRDTTRKKLSHYRIIKAMEGKEIDVLLGTQMVAKGHDFPDVTMSAVVSADVTLNLPDFRSSERTFQLFTQLAGRAGRGDIFGNVYIQTYEPEHYVFEYVRQHDYKGFYEREIELRKELSYPPFSKLIRIILSFKTMDTGKKIIKNISGMIKKMKTNDVEILGPSPAPIEKIRNLWRWHIILKGKGSKSLRQKAFEILHILKDIKDIKIDVDVDPINLM
ncbi:MAG: primosomal protein N' [Nitrospirae bacterium]|nr:primosomal protein N' [Nitrospirota bacterium]